MISAIETPEIKPHNKIVQRDLCMKVRFYFMTLIYIVLFMYTGMFVLLKSDKSRLTDYEKRAILKKGHLVF